MIERVLTHGRHDWRSYSVDFEEEAFEVEAYHCKTVNNQAGFLL
jgi:hypothetical protein